MEVLGFPNLLIVRVGVWGDFWNRSSFRHSFTR